MFCSVVDSHTELTSSLVDDECSALEDSFNIIIFIIKIVESDEVLQEFIEIAEDVKELVNHLDIIRLFFESKIRGQILLPFPN